MHVQLVEVVEDIHRRPVVVPPQYRFRFLNDQFKSGAQCQFGSDAVDLVE